MGMNLRGTKVYGVSTRSRPREVKRVKSTQEHTLKWSSARIRNPHQKSEVSMMISYHYIPSPSSLAGAAQRVLSRAQPSEGLGQKSAPLPQRQHPCAICRQSACPRASETWLGETGRRGQIRYGWGGLRWTGLRVLQSCCQVPSPPMDAPCPMRAAVCHL